MSTKARKCIKSLCTTNARTLSHIHVNRTFNVRLIRDAAAGECGLLCIYTDAHILILLLI